MEIWLVILARSEKRMDIHISGPFTLNRIGMRYIFMYILYEEEFISVVTTTELSLPLRWLAATEPHRHHSVLQCSQRSFWALFTENCPSLSQRHLIPV